MRTRNADAWIGRFVPGLYFLCLLLGLEAVYGGYFPNHFGLLGHDFALLNPMLLDGAFWFWQNGLFSIPWFTPSFCGGQPFFADTISFYYSLAQWLAFFVPPTEASHITLLISCSTGYWAFYFLARRVFSLSTEAAIVAGSMAMLNGFLPHRFLVGEVGFQAFLLSGFVCHALLSLEEWSPWQKWRLGNPFWAGLALAYLFQSGLSSLMIPAGLGIVAVACLAQIAGKGAPFKIFLQRSAIAAAFSGALCAAKILAGLAFMSHFPRNAYLLPGFANWTDALVFPALSLIFDSQTVSTWAYFRLSNVQWPVLPHEWAYQFGVASLVMILTGPVCLYFANRHDAGAKRKPNRNFNRRQLYIFILILILLIPSALLWFNPAWNALLKSLPIVNTTSFPFRWVIIWIPAACITGAMAWQAIEGVIKSSVLRLAGLAVFCLAMLVESGLSNTEYYQDLRMQRYDPKPVNLAWVNGRQGKIPPITGLVQAERDANGNWPFPQNRNDSIVHGQSYIRCYNPAFGYHLETLPVGRLRAGHPALEEKEGFLNIKNPACLIWPGENGCKAPGEEYTAQEGEQALLFLQRRPIDFQVSKAQRIADIINILALLVAAIGVVIHLTGKIRQWHGRLRPGNHI